MLLHHAVERVQADHARFAVRRPGAALLRHGGCTGCWLSLKRALLRFSQGDQYSYFPPRQSILGVQSARVTANVKRRHACFFQFKRKSADSMETFCHCFCHNLSSRRMISLFFLCHFFAHFVFKGQFKEFLSSPSSFGSRRDAPHPMSRVFKVCSLILAPLHDEHLSSTCSCFFLEPNTSPGFPSVFCYLYFGLANHPAHSSKCAHGKLTTDPVCPCFIFPQQRPHPPRQNDVACRTPAFHQHRSPILSFVNSRH